MSKNVRALDVEIATKVLKQTVQVYDTFSGGLDFSLLNDQSLNKFRVLNDYTEEYDVPYYSTDIYWAYAIMNYMIDKKYVFNLTSGWTVIICKNKVAFEVKEESLPLAIIKSILLMNDYETEKRNKVLSK